MPARLSVVRYVPPRRSKILMTMLLSAGAVGIVVGLIQPYPHLTLIITFMGVINIGLGAFFAYIFLTQEERSDRRKRRKRR